MNIYQKFIGLLDQLAKTTNNDEQILIAKDLKAIKITLNKIKELQEQIKKLEELN